MMHSSLSKQFSAKTRRNKKTSHRKAAITISAPFLPEIAYLLNRNR